MLATLLGVAMLIVLVACPAASSGGNTPQAPAKPVVPAVTATLSDAASGNLVISDLGTPTGTGTIYWAVYAGSDTQTDSAVVRAGTGALNSDAAKGSIAFSDASSGITATVAGIAAGTKYNVYVVYTAGSGSNTTDSDLTLVSGAAITASDSTLPPAKPVVPAVTATLSDAASGNLVISDLGTPTGTGTIYWAVYAESATQTDSAVVRAGTGALNSDAAKGSIAFSDASSGITAAVAGITAGTKYNVYVVYTAGSASNTTDSDLTLVSGAATTAVAATSATELGVSGTVAVGNQVGGANVTVACGSTTLSGVTKADGTYSITVGDQAAVTACSTSGVRVRATFTVDGMNYTLLSGRLPAASATSTVVNVTRISDIAVRQSAGFADSGDGNWIDSAPGSIDWDQISTNAEAIATAVGLSMVNPIEDAFDVNIDNRLEVYTIESDSTGVTISIGATGPEALLSVTDGAIAVPDTGMEATELATLETTAETMFAGLNPFDDRRVASQAPPTKPTVPNSVAATLSDAATGNLAITGLGTPSGTGHNILGSICRECHTDR